MAMKRFDHLVDNFEDALNQAKEELLRQGFYQTEEISEMIMKKGGINHFWFPSNFPYDFLNRQHWHSIDCVL